MLRFELEKKSQLTYVWGMYLGFKGTPLSVANHTESLPVTIAGRSVTYNGLDVLYMMKTKLHHCSGRVLLRNFRDIEFLINQYGPEVRAVAGQLDEDARRFFLNYETIRSRDTCTQEYYRTTLGL
jgi:hypothetical protein